MRSPGLKLAMSGFLVLGQACAHTPYVRTVDQKVKTKNAEYRNCFDTVYARESVGITDGLRMQWMISNSGEATQIKVVAQTRLGDRLGACIAKVIGGLKFNEPDKPTYIRYPFVFTKRKPEVDSNF